jgi:hypothetical protein
MSYVLSSVVFLISSLLASSTFISFTFYLLDHLVSSTSSKIISLRTLQPSYILITCSTNGQVKPLSSLNCNTKTRKRHGHRSSHISSPRHGGASREDHLLFAMSGRVRRAARVNFLEGYGRLGLRLFNEASSWHQQQSRLNTWTCCPNSLLTQPRALRSQNGQHWMIHIVA